MQFVCPAEASDDLRHLLLSLMERDVTRRLGCLKAGARDVTRHRWFTRTDWTALYHRTVRTSYLFRYLSTNFYSHLY